MRERGKEIRKREKKKRKEKEKKERKRKEAAISSSVNWRSDDQNSLDQGVKSGDSTRGYASRGRDSSYFCLFLAFRLLFCVDFGTVLCHVNGMGRVCSHF